MCNCGCSVKLSSVLETLHSLQQRVLELEKCALLRKSMTDDTNMQADPRSTPESREKHPDARKRESPSKVADENSKAPAPCVAPSDPAPETARAAIILPEMAMDATRVVMQQLCRPMDCDQLGVCLAGTVMSWIDLCAGLSSKMAARGPCVTASVDAVHFVRPLKANTIVIIDAVVNRTFSSSMEVQVRVQEEDPRTGECAECCHAFLTFVSLHSLKRPGSASAKPLPRIIPSTPGQRAAQAAALRRRELRLSKNRARDGAVESETTLPPRDHTGIAVPNTRMLRRSASMSGAMSKAAVPPSASLSHTTQRVMPHHANTLGITFGGQVLSWVESAAYLSAIRLNLSGQMLTAAMDAVTFREPTRVGDVLYFTSMATAVFRSSVEVLVSVHAERPNEPESRPFFVLDAFVTLVSVGNNGLPQPLQISLLPGTGVERKRTEEAHNRRSQRLQLREVFTRHAASDGGFQETLSC